MMFVSPDTKLEGNLYDAELGLFLDVAAEVQLYPLWWDDDPEAYELLKARRKEHGVEVEDHLKIAPWDMDGLMSNDDIMKSLEDEEDD